MTEYAPRVDEGQVLAERLAATADATEQWRLVHGALPGEAPVSHSVTESEALLSFAATAEGSRYVRTYALERGLQGLLNSERRGEELNEEQRQIVERFRRVLPKDYFDPIAHYYATTAYGERECPWPAEHARTTHSPSDYGHTYQRMFMKLALTEGLDGDLVSKDIDRDDWSGVSVTDAIPVAAGMLVTDAMRMNMKELTKARIVDSLSPAMTQDAMDIMLSFNKPEFEERARRFKETAPLARFTRAGGLEHDGPIDFLYNLPDIDRQPYAEVFTRLYESASVLGEAYPVPPELQMQISSGAVHLLANALFAVQKHIQRGYRTDTSISIHDVFTIPVHFKDDEPLQLLTKLDHVFRKIHHVATTADSRALPAAEGVEGGFTIDRIAAINSVLPPTVALYIRPEGAASFDPLYEYGRHGKGVGASINIISQVDDMTLLPLAKVGGSHDTISIRLDREAGDKVALDVGSILGAPGMFGTQIGYLLAVGNQIRGKATGKEIGLNHVREWIEQGYGTSSAFATLAKGAQRMLDSKRCTEAERSAYMRGLSLSSAARMLLAAN